MSARSRAAVAAPLLALAVAPALRALPATRTPVHVRFVEANTSACEWGGEPTFTCRELVAPVVLDLQFAPGELPVVVSVDGERAGERATPGVVELGMLAPGAHRVGIAAGSFRRELRIDVGPPRADAELPPPVVRIAAPAAGAILEDDVVVTVQAHNPRSPHRAVERVELLVDGRLQEARESEPWTFSWRTAAAGPGRHRLTARARGSRGLWSEAEAEVVVRVARSLRPAADLHVAAGPPTVVRIAIPAGVARCTLVTRLSMTLAGAGSLRGLLRTEEGREEGLFALASPVDPPIPFERDLTRHAGHTVDLVVGAAGGARGALLDLEVRAYE